MRKYKIILTIAAALLGGAALPAQDWTAGVGYTRTAFTGKECSSFLSSHPLNGFYAGVSRDFYFSPLAGLTLEPGLFFVYQTARNDAGLSPKFLYMHYLSLPVNVKYTFDLVPGSLTASVYSGPVFNVGILGNMYRDGNFVTGIELPDITRHLTRPNVQWDFGVTATVASAVQLRLSYAIGMSRLLPEQDVHNNTLSVGVGFLF